MIGLVNSVIVFLSQTTLCRWLPFLLGSQTDSDSPAVWDLFISSDASICSVMAFPPSGNSAYVFVSVSIDFPSNSQRDATFHCISYDYSHADWDGLRDHIFKLSAFAAASKFCSGFRLELMYIFLVTSIRVSCQASLISMVFSFLYCCHSS